MNYDYKNLRPFKWFVLQNFPFIEVDFDAITNWQLFCKLGEEINKVINSMNLTGEQVESLTNAFNDLQAYVNNYFENLDIQEEVNEKLDKMAESGELEAIIAQYLNMTSIFCYNNVNEMINSESLSNGKFVKTSGFYSYNDGGGAFYKIRNVTTDDVIDNMTKFAIINNNQVIAELVINTTSINPLQLGAKGNGIDDDLIPIQKAIDIGNVNLGNKTYKLSDSLIIPSNRIIEGGKSELITTQGKYAIKIEGDTINNAKTNITIKDIRINTLNGGDGIYMKDSYFIYLDTINIFQLSEEDSIGFKIINGFNHEIKNSRVYGNNSIGQIGLDITTTTGEIANVTNVKYDGLLLQNLTYGVKCNYTATANTVEFNNTGFSNCDYCFYIEGFTLPMSISNTRMESNKNSGYGFYIVDHPQLVINNLNAYNIPRVIYTTSDRDLQLTGAIALTGTSQSPLYMFVDSSSTGKIINLANCVNFGSVYNNGYSNMTQNKKTFMSEITGNNVTLSNTGIGIYEITGSSNLQNIFGKKGGECYIWTKLSGKVVNGWSPSITNKWSGNITLEPYKMYHFIAIGDSEICYID